MARKQNILIKALLGHWLGHPLHPAIVHMPIALWVGAWVLGSGAIRRKRPQRATDRARTHRVALPPNSRAGLSGSL
jgi:hypothetical protein